MNNRIRPHDSIRNVNRPEPTPEKDERFWRAIEHYNSVFNAHLFNVAHEALIQYELLKRGVRSRSDLESGEFLCVLEDVDAYMNAIIDLALAVCGSAYHRTIPNAEARLPLLPEVIVFLAPFASPFAATSPL